MIPGNHDECARIPKITQAPGLDRFGTYNMFPEPAREISVSTFTKLILRRELKGTETRQPRDLNYATLVIFWLGPGYSVGISRRNDGGHYWFFGCEHKLVEQEVTESQRDLVGDHAHGYICELCGYGLTVDSSG